MNAVEIEEAVSDLVLQPFDRAEFPFQFLEAFGNKETTLKRLQSGSSNRTDVDGAVLQRTNIHILATNPGGVEAGLKALRESPKTAQQKAKFILATDGTDIQAEDLSSGEVLACAYTDLPMHFGFLLPLAGITTVSEIKNNPIDIKATGRLDKLYVALLQDERNADWAAEKNRERFNHFMAQLIFCFFAEDTGIFRGDNLFTATVGQMSESDGSNTQEIITNIFAAMNLDLRKGERAGVRPYADGFPYVNGGLFGGDVAVPVFSKMARTYLLRAGDLDWTAINPDIFGSMIQAVADDEERGELGMHYTSVPNILKVLNPLFLDSLNADLKKAGRNKQQLGKLKKRIARIRVFDPACGSGNFLVIAYKKMREIEHKANQAAGWETEKSVIPLTNFRGIELKSFAAEIARLALIIAEYQCDELYMGQREALALFLPLEKTNWITCGNALRLDWLSICPPTGETSVKLHGDDLFNTPLDQSEIDFENEGGETYICGNPPYLGGKKQNSEQKLDLKRLFPSSVSTKNLDYVCGFMLLGAKYLSSNDAMSFVATSSVSQGIHVPLLWPLLFNEGVFIFFAHLPFQWSNNAKNNAGVWVNITGLTKREMGISKIYQDESVRSVSKINAYLVPSSNVIVQKRSLPLSPISKMTTGNAPYDGGYLILEKTELDRLGLTNEQKTKLTRKLVATSEFNSGIARTCLWIEDDDLDYARQVSGILERIDKVKVYRLHGGSVARSLLNTPHQFRYRNISKQQTLMVPQVSPFESEFMAIGFLEPRIIVTHLAHAVYDGTLADLSFLSSRLHMVWSKTMCGRLGNGLRYSSNLCWNTFPVPKLTTINKDDLTRAAENILLAREAHFPATIADLYKPASDKHAGMPENLRAAHEENDRILEEIYIGRRFKNDTERLEKLFEMYTEMTSKVGA